MTTDSGEIERTVVPIVMSLLRDEKDKTKITPTLIAQKLDDVLRINQKWAKGIDRQSAIDELIRRNSEWVGRISKLKNDEGHKDWLKADRKKSWRYWTRYSEWMGDGLSDTALESLDTATDAILGLLEDPLREGSWDRRGLVVGHVQSGKTGNYTGLICKAADAGYKIIIVLAGLHNNLRSQTQMRLDEGFLGFESMPNLTDVRLIGVSEKDNDQSIRPNFATNRSEKGDFSTAVARNLGITPEQRPWLFVVKKNKTVLDRLHRWLRDHVKDGQDAETGRPIITKLPLLLIDDEADHASVDTGEEVTDAEGRPDEEHQPTAINGLIRRILHTFSRSAYVGYTATPFANIFIHERGATRIEGPDLFPSAFIISLSAPSEYVGPSRMFGTGAEDGHALPLIRSITDYTTTNGSGGWMPSKHKSTHQPLFDGRDEIPTSLVEAIDAFILACAVRRLRGHAHHHVSMLVHVTRLTAVQKLVHHQVETHIGQIKQRMKRGIGHEPILGRLKELWERDFVPSSARIRAGNPAQAPHAQYALPQWRDVAAELADAVLDIKVKTINGGAKDALDYAEKKGTGLKVIAIGGDKLSRGLTLEGLCVSYFLRASKMYDTLMQMGRWFGYRPHYLDLCRLYTTEELTEWFGHISEAAEELREEFDLMEAAGATPRAYGLKVQSHSVLTVTSRLKMRTAKNLMLSFSGQLLETVALYRNPAVLSQNLDALRRLVSAMGTPQANPTRFRNSTKQQWEGYLWERVPAADILDFLNAYKTHKAAMKLNATVVAEFIRSMLTVRELTEWTVVVIGGGQGRELDIGNGRTVTMLKRSRKSYDEERYSIGRLLSPRDEAIDLDEEAWNAALAKTRSAWHADPARQDDVGVPSPPDAPNGTAIRWIRGFGAEGVPPHPERGLLLLYALDPLMAVEDEGQDSQFFPPDTPSIIAFGVSFAGSNAGRKVEYKVNNVLWEQEYGQSE